MKRIPYITVLGCIIIAILISACGEKNIKSNLIIGNRSSEIISNIAIQRIGKTEIRGSNLKQNQHCYFDMGVQKNCTYKVEFEDRNNKSTLSNEFTCNFNKEGIVNINVLKDNNGKWEVVLN
ncbi:hypothetical protein [Clostridium estertheticum]|uniref:hypothetical protein n=1 Tax=Clostridium estertheticum TaxID=238834 RepID=UPI001C7E0C67|nr:hypothetical protein [Clostridium estertheticum]MBX4264636.1 hypothetical protein [Clostridium estertheticum]MBX4268312.1 hypothetical protein [Clostridium estertheticum]WLC81618.1 hypothetical protein KTC98_10615 [Clostridium estertheticum]WLC88771.1 hypothetical protein KTC95_00585 [Clostridium estertheticum]